MVDFSDPKIREGKIGLELDKMELPGISRAVRPQQGGYRGVQQRLIVKKTERRHSIVILFLLISAVTLPIVLLYCLWDRGVVDLPLLQSKKAERVLKRYETVGPVMTSVGHNQHVKLTVKIECKNSRLKDRLAQINPALKGKLLIALSAPEAKEKLRTQDYDALKSYLKKEIDGLLQKESVEAVYFSDIVFY